MYIQHDVRLPNFWEDDLSEVYTQSGRSIKQSILQNTCIGLVPNTFIWP